MTVTLGKRAKVLMAELARDVRQRTGPAPLRFVSRPLPPPPRSLLSQQSDDHMQRIMSFLGPADSAALASTSRTMLRHVSTSRAQPEFEASYWDYVRFLLINNERPTGLNAEWAAHPNIRVPIRSLRLRVGWGFETRQDVELCVRNMIVVLSDVARRAFELSDAHITIDRFADEDDEDAITFTDQHLSQMAGAIAKLILRMPIENINIVTPFVSFERRVRAGLQELPPTRAVNISFRVDRL